MTMSPTRTSSTLRHVRSAISTFDPAGKHVDPHELEQSQLVTQFVAMLSALVASVERSSAPVAGMVKRPPFTT